MKDCSKDILKYHADAVTLPKEIQERLRGNRNANRDRLKRGLDKDNKPHPDTFIIQGSYAMKTMKRHPENDYDIDDGAAFSSDKLKHDDGTFLTPLEARQRVKKALIDGGGLSDTPVVKRNCVRINYAAGHHVDIPVYRVSKNFLGAEIREFASGDEWRESNPVEITDWYRSEEKTTHKDGEAEPQLRRLTRLVKMYAANNLADNALSGLLLTVLSAEQHLQYEPREDKAFRDLLSKIRTRLIWNKTILNPANSSEQLNKEKDIEKCEKLIAQIDNSLKKLEILDDEDCSQIEARDAWDTVFKTTFFSKLQADERSNQEPTTPSNSYPDKRVNIQGSGTAA